MRRFILWLDRVEWGDLLSLGFMYVTTSAALAFLLAGVRCGFGPMSTAPWVSSFVFSYGVSGAIFLTVTQWSKVVRWAEKPPAVKPPSADQWETEAKREVERLLGERP